MKHETTIATIGTGNAEEIAAENFQRARKVVRQTLTPGGRKQWLALDDMGEFSRTNKATAIAILKEFGLTIDTFLAEQEKFIAAESTKVSAQMAIEERAHFLKAKIDSERKAIDDETAFDLLPTVDELNDTRITDKDFSDEATFTMTATEAAKTVLRLNGNLRHMWNFHEVSLSKPDDDILWTRTFHGDGGYEVEEVLNHPYGTLSEVWIRNYAGRIVTIKIAADPWFKQKRETVTKLEDTVKNSAETASDTDGTTKIGAETVTFCNGKFFSVYSETYRAEFVVDCIGIFHYRIYDEGDTRREVSYDEFFATIDKRANIGEGTEKFAGKNDYEIGEELTDELRDIVIGGKHRCMDVTLQNGKKIVTCFGATFITPDWHESDGFIFTHSWGDKLAVYDTPAQIETVIHMLKTAIERGDTEFKFPNAAELNPPEYDEKKWAVDFDIYHADGDLSEEELQGYTDKLRTAMTANGNRACVDLEDCVIVIYGDDGGDNKTVEKIIAEMHEHDCWQEWPEIDEDDEDEKARLG